MTLGKRIYLDGKESNYTITKSGKLYSLNYMNTGKPHRLKTRLDKDGYEISTIYLNGKRYDRKVHRLVAEAYIPNPKNKPEVNHKNGKKNDNRRVNLEWATTAENVAHAFKTGLNRGDPGEQNPMAKYTAKRIKKVCKLLESGDLGFKEIAKKTKVDKGTVASVYYRKNWSDVSKKYDFSKFDKRLYKRPTKKKIILICTLLEITDRPLNDVAFETGVDCSLVRRIYKRETHTDISKDYKFLKRL